MNEVIKTLNAIATTGQPNEINPVWLRHLPIGETFDGLLNARGLRAVYMPNTDRYFVEKSK